MEVLLSAAVWTEVPISVGSTFRIQSQTGAGLMIAQSIVQPPNDAKGFRIDEDAIIEDRLHDVNKLWVTVENTSPSAGICYVEERS